MEKITLEPVQRGVLQDIGDVQPLGDSDYEVLKEIGDVLRRHKRTDRFGVCLLHKHFDIEDDEELVEETDTQERISTTRVQKASAQNGRTIETMWRFSDNMKTITKCVLRCIYSGGHSRYHVREAH